MSDSLLEEMAQGRGKRLIALAELMGCDGEGQHAFGPIVQSRFGELVTDDPVLPGALLTRLRRVLREEPRTRAHCAVA